MVDAFAINPLTRRRGPYNLLKPRGQISRMRAFFDSIMVEYSGGLGGFGRTEYGSKL